MRRLLSNESENRRKLQLLSAIIIITGYLILYAVFQITSDSEKHNISQEADKVMDFLQSSCQKYDDYQLGNQVENLQNLQLKAENLPESLAELVKAPELPVDNGNKKAEEEADRRQHKEYEQLSLTLQE